MKHVMLGLALLVSACDPVSVEGDAGAEVIDGAVFDVMVVPGIDGGPDASTAICAPNPGCEAEAEVVSTVGDIKAFVDGCADWSEADIDSFRARTRNLVTGTSMFLCPGDFRLPDACFAQGSTPCLPDVVIQVDNRLAADPTAACNGISIGAGVRFRLRMHLGLPNQAVSERQARLTFEPPCDAECSADERRCQANQACYQGDDVCFACGLGSREECACKTPDQEELPECSRCSVLYGDFISGGNCHNGACNNSVQSEPDICQACPAAEICPV